MSSPALDKLREINAVASGPEPYDDPATCTHIDPCPGYDAMLEHQAANARLDKIGHALLLPAMEALDKVAEWADTLNRPPGFAEDAHAVLTQLEEALKDA